MRQHNNPHQSRELIWIHFPKEKWICINFHSGISIVSPTPGYPFRASARDIGDEDVGGCEMGILVVQELFQLLPHVTVFTIFNNIIWNCWTGILIMWTGPFSSWSHIPRSFYTPPCPSVFVPKTLQINCLFEWKLRMNEETVVSLIKLPKNSSMCIQWRAINP